MTADRKCRLSEMPLAVRCGEVMHTTFQRRVFVLEKNPVSGWTLLMKCCCDFFCRFFNDLHIALSEFPRGQGGFRFPTGTRDKVKMIVHNNLVDTATI
jgi:hypothetical protein